MKTGMRTHTNGELNDSNVRKRVTLCGWCHHRRDHGGVIFIDLRDRYGITQVVFDPKFNKKSHSVGEKLRREDCIQVEGVVKRRKKGMENKKLKTGGIEVFVEKLEVLNKSPTPPLEIDDRIVANEDVRLKYRYLDLRRPIMQRNLLLRHKALQLTREFFSSQDFMEIETPILLQPTPEGARDYLVPSRVNPGRFYGLPQSPQMYKQLLMIAGYDRYFQIARCFRDEDLRQDRQPEFTQLDIEMSFVNQEDIFEIMERWLQHIFKKSLGKNIKIPFPRIPYKESMERYGIDKPDLRFGLELVDVTDAVKGSKFSVFNNVIKSKGIVKCVNPEHDFTRKELDAYADLAIKLGAKGMAWMKYEKGKLESNITKFFSEKDLKNLIKKTKIKKGALFFIADKEEVVNNVLSSIRLDLGEKLELIDKDKFEFCWITEFPLFSKNEETGEYEAEHHPFTGVVEEDIPKLGKDLGNIRSLSYDVVLNGVELGSGSIRIHDQELQQKIFKTLKLSEKDIKRRFGFFIDALKFAVPHGGVAPGFDRLIALMLGYTDIREAIAFPKNKNAQNPMDTSPGVVDEKQLKELHIKLDVVKNEDNKKPN